MTESAPPPRAPGGRAAYPLAAPTDAGDTAAATHLVLECLADASGTDELSEALGSLLDALRPTTDDEALAAIRSSAIRAHELIAYQHRRSSELAALHQIAVDLARVRDPDDVLEAIVRAAHAVIPSADATYLLLAEPGTGWNYIKASVGLHNPDFMHVRVRDGYGMVATIFQTRAPMWTRNYTASTSFEHDSVVDSALADDGLCSVLGIPMIVHGLPRGILYAGNRFERTFSSEEVSVLQSFADLASIALENAEFLAGLQQTADDIGEDMSAVERAAQLHADLTQVVIDGSDLTSVVEPISAVFAGDLFLLDNTDQTLASTSGTDPSATALEQLRQSHRAGVCVSLSSDEGWRHTVTVATGNAYFGAIVLEGAAEFSDLDRRTFERAAHIVTLLTLQQRAVVEAEDQVRGEFLHEALETRGPLSDASQLRAATRGVDLGRPMIAVAVSVPTTRQLAARRAAADLARTMAGVGGEHNGLVAAIVAGDDPTAVAESFSRRLDKELGIPALVCASGTVDGATGDLATAFVEARRCLDLLRSLGTTARAVTTEEFALFGMLFTPGREHELDRFLSSTLGTLRDYDEANGSQLLTTLSTYLATSTNMARTARALFVHPNTVVKRLERIESLLGPSWQIEPTATRLRVALLLQSYLDGSTAGASSDDGV